MIQNLPDYTNYREKILTNHPTYNFPLEIIKSDFTENNPIDFPKISVITPSYNQGKYLEKTIQSVLGQHYPNLEYFIIDGGSTDNSAEIIQKYKSCISFAVSEKDRGQSHAINKGFSLASGDIFCWLNSDDYFLPNTLMQVAKVFMSTKASFVYGNGYNLVNNQLIPNISGINFDRYLRIPMFIQPSCFWKKEIHQPIWEDLHCTMDYELWLRIVKGNKRKYLNRFLSVALVHEEAKTYNPSLEAKAKWQDDHIKEIAIHGDVNNWKQILKENHYIQKFLRTFSTLKSFF